jgi:hypothetical protein
MGLRAARSGKYRGGLAEKNPAIPTTVWPRPGPEVQAER